MPEERYPADHSAGSFQEIAPGRFVGGSTHCVPDLNVTQQGFSVKLEGPFQLTAQRGLEISPMTQKFGGMATRAKSEMRLKLRPQLMWSQAIFGHIRLGTPAPSIYKKTARRNFGIADDPESQAPALSPRALQRR
jgi:hypothetical protein